MAQYKVPQDVEADDKLIGPFSFRQFVYLLIAAGCIAAAVGLFQIFPLLAIVPVLPALFFIVLALPLKKDQPMETYLAALVSYYLKPRNRMWAPGQRESTILITAPKIKEDTRTRNLSEEEATHRLSFLAEIMDSEGYAIKGAANNSMREDLIAEANATKDMFDNYRSGVLSNSVRQDVIDRHNEAVRAMREAIANNNDTFGGSNSVTGHGTQFGGQAWQTQTLPQIQPQAQPQAYNQSQTQWPSQMQGQLQMQNQTKPAQGQPQMQTNVATKQVNESIIELANNPDYTIATIAKEANRINRKDGSEVFVSLH